MSPMNPDEAARALGFPSAGMAAASTAADFDFELDGCDVVEIVDQKLIPPSSFGTVRKPALLNMPQENF